MKRHNTLRIAPGHALGAWAALVTALCLGALATPGLARADAPPAKGDPGPAPAAASGSAQAAAAPEIVVEDRELDLANIVTSAAKGVTTVQEAPAIITIITAEEIKQRGYQNIGQVLSSIPGWIDVSGFGNQVQLPMVRGTIQAALYLRDGVSLFDPAFNAPSLNRGLSLENIKRVEVVTGPGGVLWGANSYMGIVNVITKDADDVNWLEANIGYGDGAGDASHFRAYAMFGHSWWKDRVKLFLHASYENYLGTQFTGRQYYVGSPTPQPLGPAIYGYGNVSSDIARSWILNTDGKLSIGPVSLYFNMPFGEMNYASTFGPPVIVMDRGADGKVCPGCDRSMWNFYERYGIAEYRDRFANQKVGLDAKAYYIEFIRDIALRVFPSSTGLPGGLTGSYPDLKIIRYGGNVDFDWSGPWKWNRLLAGAELFHEEAGGNGPGGSATSVFLQPDAANLPLACRVSDARTMTPVPGCQIPFIFGGAERTVAGAFIADQIRPYSKLTIDGGVRYQQGFGHLPYAPQILGAAAAVWQFLPDLHLKLNFSQGFRPPVFNNTNGNGAAVQFAGNPNLRVETSESYSAEVNARLLRNVRKVRELQLRLDYAYTLLNDIIVIRGGLYTNSGRRAINSIEFLGKLYLQGDHFLSLAYTYQQIATTDGGEFKSVPHHFLQVGAVFNLIKSVLDVNTNLTIYGSASDPNRVPTTDTSKLPGMSSIVGQITNFTYDTLPPVALLQLGLRLRLWKEHIALSAQFYNVLNQHYYQPDVFYDQTPIIENRPNPAANFSFFTSLTYRP